MMPMVHVIGRKNSGKTTLIVELIGELTARGLRVGSIKHTHHHHELDVPGKDSFRHRQAGASPVAILSPGMTAVFRPNESGIAGQGYAWLEPAFRDCDLVLVEGDSQAVATKIEVWRAATGASPMAAEDRLIRAVVTDDQLAVPQPIWPRANICAVADGVLTLARGA
ncbi:MAG: molybdopterin-guanine dinucleotide biosynthesis protein B [Pirellulales bacterium]